MSYRIPIGPYHLALEEPYKIELECEGSRVTGASLKVGYNFRGIEWLVERKNITQAITLMERVCGICSHVHAMTFCMALEHIGGIEVPPRAQYIRVVMAELERLHSHLLWTGVAAELIGFQTLFMQVFRLRERVMDLLESISGNRVNYSMNCIGGVTRDIADTTAALAAVTEVREAVTRWIIPVFTTDRTVAARCRNSGVLKKAEAQAYGTIGPVARASGISQDLRRDSPYLCYRDFEFRVPVDESGDVFARLTTRAREMIESCRILEQALRQIPPGRLSGGWIAAVPRGETAMRTEAPRGELFYFVASDGSDTLARVKVRTPSFMNIPAVVRMVKDCDLADVPLIQASVDPCYSCTDR